MKNLKIFQKLSIGFGVVIVLTIILAVTAVLSSSAMDAEYTHLLEFPQQRIITMLKISNDFMSARRAMYNMSIFAGMDGSESRIHTLTDLIGLAFADINKSLAAYERLIIEDAYFSDDEKIARMAAIGNIKALSEQWHGEVVDQVIQASLEGRRQDVVGIIDETTHISSGLFDAVDALIDLATNTTATMSKNTSADADRSTLILIALSVIIVLISVGFAVVIPSGIVKPLAPLSSFMGNAGSTGSLTIQPEDLKIIEKFKLYKDEIGQCITGALAFVRHVTDTAKELDAVAAGDLTVNVRLLSETDEMGVALKSMIDNLNRMFSEIAASASEVSTGAKQVAQSAQSMAQGATEQAASMQEFSSSIAVLAEKTKENADTADKTARLSGEIINSAENGSQQMDEMIDAVRDISHASQNISKIIKVIDDIAFQTNILALNAAVEAARAGEYGKGFAVVAEEVRNLASKSAEAAKETGAMIENAMAKAELGANIANETAASLAEIIHGITESSKLIQEIAVASEEQKLGIEQINIGVDQVAQVVQQNAVTAEESAAAAEEMDAQSSLLLELVALFSLKETGRSGAEEKTASVGAGTVKRAYLPGSSEKY